MKEKKKKQKAVDMEQNHKESCESIDNKQKLKSDSKKESFNKDNEEMKELKRNHAFI